VYRLPTALHEALRECGEAHDRTHAIASELYLRPMHQRSKCATAERMKGEVRQQLTTMPMSDLVLSSTVLSSTRFMNWSNPRSVPVTCRLALSATAGTACDSNSGWAEQSRQAQAQRSKRTMRSRQDRAQLCRDRVERDEA